MLMDINCKPSIVLKMFPVQRSKIDKYSCRTLFNPLFSKKQLNPRKATVD
jgi:hypothetical protein